MVTILTRNLSDTPKIASSVCTQVVLADISNILSFAVFQKVWVGRFGLPILSPKDSVLPDYTIPI